MLAAYETGRGGFRVRAQLDGRARQARHLAGVVTEIPYQVQKARLIEQIAALMEERKLPLLGDVRDESTETVRLVLEPKTRGVEPEVLMETLFRATALETALPAQHERAGRDPHAARDEAAGRAAGVARSPPRGAVAALPPPAGGDRAAARDPRRLSRRVSQSRRGDPHHPRGGRAQAAPDRAVHADRPAGRGDPQHAPAQPAPARGDGDPARAQGADQGAQGGPGAARSDEKRRWDADRGRDRGDRAPSSASGPLGDRRTEMGDAPAAG